MTERPRGNAVAIAAPKRSSLSIGSICRMTIRVPSAPAKHAGRGDASSAERLTFDPAAGRPAERRSAGKRCGEPPMRPQRPGPSSAPPDIRSDGSASGDAECGKSARTSTKPILSATGSIIAAVAHRWTSSTAPSPRPTHGNTTRRIAMRYARAGDGGWTHSRLRGGRNGMKECDRPPRDTAKGRRSAR